MQRLRLAGGGAWQGWASVLKPAAADVWINWWVTISCAIKSILLHFCLPPPFQIQKLRPLLTNDRSRKRCTGAWDFNIEASRPVPPSKCFDLAHHLYVGDCVELRCWNQLQQRWCEHSQRGQWELGGGCAHFQVLAWWLGSERSAAFIISWLRTKWWSFCMVDGMQRRAPLASCLANTKKEKGLCKLKFRFVWSYFSLIGKYFLNK
jgi:hypothetical protein